MKHPRTLEHTRVVKAAEEAVTSYWEAGYPGPHDQGSRSLTWDENVEGFFRNTFVYDTACGGRCEGASWRAYRMEAQKAMDCLSRSDEHWRTASREVAVLTGRPSPSHSATTRREHRELVDVDVKVTLDDELAYPGTVTLARHSDGQLTTYGVDDDLLHLLRKSLSEEQYQLVRQHIEREAIKAVICSD